MSKNKEAEIELRKNPINVFSCGHADCTKLGGMGLYEFMDHLASKHGVSKNQMKGKKQMLAHIDGDYWFSSTYDWELESGLKFTQFVKLARDEKTRHY